MSNIQRRYEFKDLKTQSDGFEDEDYGDLANTKEMRMAATTKFDMGNGYSSIFTRPLTPN